MADASSNLNIIISAQDQASEVLDNLDKKSSSLGSNIKNTLKNSVVELGGAFAATTGVIYGAINAYDEHQRSITQLNAVLTSTNGIAGVTADAVTKLSDALERSSTFDKDAITNAQNLLLTFTNIGSNVFPQATQAILDTSVALGQDLNNTAIQVGKALNDPIQGLTALRRVGVSFTDDQKEQIKTLVESGNTLAAQKIILQELTTEFGGSASAAAKTFSGQMQQLKNTANDLQVTLGGGLVDALNKLTGGQNGAANSLEKLNKFLQDHHDVLMGVSIALIALAATFGVLLVAALAAAAGASLAFVGIVGVIVAAVGFAAGFIIEHWNQITENIKQAVAFWEGVVKVIIGAVLDFIKQKVQDTADSWINAFTSIKNVIEGVIDTIGRLIDAAKKIGGKIASSLGLSFQHGGIVPGGPNDAVPAILHGGERVTPPTGMDVNGGGGMSNNITLNFTGDISMDSSARVQELAEQVARVLGRQNELASKGVSI